MSAKKILVVVGATGNQGSSVANTFLALPQWHVRCLTRNPSSEKSKGLASRGAEVVQADLHDPTSLAAAFQNANAIFLNTDYWATWKPAVASGSPPEEASKKATEFETTQGKNAVDEAAKISTLERFVYSSLPAPSKVSGGKYYRSGHCEAKGLIVEYIEREHPELWKKTSLIILGAYRDNAMLAPKLDAASGRYVFASPLKESTVLPIIDPSTSTGPFVRCLVEDEAPQTKLLAYDTNSEPTFREFIDAWSKASGKDAGYKWLSTEDMLKAGLSYEHIDAVSCMNEFGYARAIEGVITPDRLKQQPRTKTFEEWLGEKDWEQALKA